MMTGPGKKLEVRLETMRLRMVWAGEDEELEQGLWNRCKRESMWRQTDWVVDSFSA